MLFLLSPAKALDYDTPLPAGLAHSTPRFLAQSAALIEVLRSKSAQDLADLMHLSDKLAALNVARYRAWTPRFTSANSRQALLAFNGDVYAGLQARTLSAADLDWAQEHVLVLSGLYGVLRPLDRMQAYRLEMGSRLATDAGSNLYQYWGSRIAKHLNTRLQADVTPVVVNLASQEYFKAVDRRALKARVVECVFEDWRGGAYKIIGLHAKRARGLMARHAITHRITTAHGLEGFALDGYAFAPAASDPERLVFRRKAPAPRTPNPVATEGPA
ncbi:peroxide stress protein YaaA [Verminephrobacter aporrectodeae]|uniref:peroxide stress protein YaaA n=1 Tax=Verminephrobacter aporrectodeae TaxID=1110389 RepID=UPI0022444CA9|nr:peroxide stress protein YaaA [Verminephrobacter aporrectodeae]MCW8174705.1 peroxide stress protein YaaA [Verminephrobacter aporrectodeae subsp. tuberculatae]MCW8201295.1 peroxide stress protein YaaA [Verminephrobacter aporrectodeae subsp. tuberculatae]